MPQSGANLKTTFRSRRRSVRASLQCLALLFAASAVGLLSVSSSSALSTTTCRADAATNAVVGRLTATVAWRAELLGQTDFYTSIPRDGVRRLGSIAPSQAGRHTHPDPLRRGKNMIEGISDMPAGTIGFKDNG